MTNIKNLFTTILITLLLSNTAQSALSPIRSTVEINTFTLNGPLLNNDDYYGYGASEIGDFDGDGITDIAVGNWGSDVGGLNRGAVQISFLNANGSIKSTTVINGSTLNGPILNDSDNYGISVASLGDLDGDGITDLLVGTWGDDAGGSNRGTVHIHFLNADASIKSTVEINSLTPNGPVLANSDIYGVDVASMGDFDGDGINDIIVGAFQDDSGGSNRGAAYISLLNTDGSVKSTTKISSLTPNGPVLANGSGYGRGVTSLGDLDGDGITDIAVGAETDSTGGPLRGAVHISFLNADASVKSTVKISSLTPNGPGALLSDGDRYGVKTMNLGDLDDDGIVDLGVGAYVDDADDMVGADRGSFYIHFLNTDGSIKSTTKINHITPNGPVLNNVDYYGTSILNLGDMDGDGLPEIAIGAGGNDTGGSNRGTLHIHFTNSFVTPPAPAVITPPASSTVYNDQTPTFTGTGSFPGNTITIMDGATLIGTGTIAGDNTWSITSGPTLPYASYNFTIYESSVFDGPALLHPVTLASDIVPPANPASAPDLQTASDTGLYDNDNLTSQNTPTFDFVCTEIGSTINLYSDNPAPNTLIGTHTCTFIGTDGATVSAPLSDGIHNVTYTEEDSAGNESAHSPSLGVTIDTTPPGAVAVISVGGDTSSPYTTTDTTPDIVITSVIGDTVTIAGFTCTPLPATSTSVVCTANVAYSSPSNQTVIASIVDLAGNGPTNSNISFSVVNPSPVQPIAGGRPQSWPATNTGNIPEIPFDKPSCLKEQVASSPFTDISGHFAEEAIILLANTLSTDTSITQGYLDNNNRKVYKPDQYITRAEFLKMSLLSNCEVIDLWNKTNQQPSKIFNDVTLENDPWYKNYIYSALANGIIDGYEDGNFYPDAPITRAEASKILINIQDLIKDNYIGTKYFPDVTENDWFYKFVSAGKENNLIYGYEDNTFKPYNNISRAETALMLVRIFTKN